MLAKLPRPLDSVNGRCVAREVYGGAIGSCKRKRTEMAIGIDGEGVNIYDVLLRHIVPLCDSS